MLLYPNAKINIGLRITSRRPDGYHNLHSLMVPIGWRDTLVVERSEGPGSFFVSAYGEAPRRVAGHEAEANLVIKAQRALERHLGRTFPPLAILLDKHIPMGAGLGGGSSDASAMLLALNDLFTLGLEREELARVAATVGADCPFFIYNRPMLMEGIGDILVPVEVPALDGMWCLTVMPEGESVSTKEAYAGVTPRPLTDDEHLEKILTVAPDFWGRNGTPLPVNDFEASVFPAHPGIADLRQLLTNGAAYVSMSGSGAAVFALYKDPDLARLTYGTLKSFQNSLQMNLTQLSGGE